MTGPERSTCANCGVQITASQITNVWRDAFLSVRCMSNVHPYHVPVPPVPSTEETPK